MFDKLKSLFGDKPSEPKSKSTQKHVPPRPLPAKRKSKEKSEPVLSEKEKATMAGEPYVSIAKVEVDPENINAGSFELDWNDKFVLNLVRAGYKQRDDDTDAVIVDRWFQTVCRNIALELYEQQVADPENRTGDDLRRVNAKDLGNGRTEIS